MREIKFRVWDDANKDMEFWGLQDRNYYACDGDSRYHIMQYTGLKDKNGKEIYEGDIVSTAVLREQNILVEFIMGCFYPFINGEDIRIEAHDVAVIGNIWENPDLLEDE